MAGKTLNTILTVSTLILTGYLTLTKSAVAKETNFLCLNQSGNWTTVVRNDYGDFPIIRWVSTLGNGEYPPERRCQIVSEKFQKFYDQGTLKFLTTGRENRQNVICVSKTQEGACTGTLYTLKPNDNPKQALQNLLDVRIRARSDIIIETDSRLYIDISRFLEQEIKEKINFNTNQPTNNPVDNSQVPQQAPLWE